MSEFSKHPSAEEIARGVDLSGKVAVVTGAGGGIGEETARVLAGCGATVVVVARTQRKADDAIARLEARRPDAKLEPLAMDLADLDSVRRAAAELLERHPRIDLLINNAGIMACPLERSREGCDLQFATNHIGHFLFTCKLIPALKAGRARVVNLSSAGHKYGRVDFDDPFFQRKPYNKSAAYGQSKTANCLFSVELTRRLGDAGVFSNAVHPGVIVTSLGRYVPEEEQERVRQYMENHPQSKDVAHGAATTVWAALAPELEGRGGLYLENCRIAEPEREQNPSEGYKDYALDPEAAERLWRLSEDIVGERFEI